MLDQSFILEVRIYEPRVLVSGADLLTIFRKFWTEIEWKDLKIVTTLVPILGQWHKDIYGGKKKKSPKVPEK